MLLKVVKMMRAIALYDECSADVNVRYIPLYSYPNLYRQHLTAALHEAKTLCSIQNRPIEIQNSPHSSFNLLLRNWAHRGAAASRATQATILKPCHNDIIPKDIGHDHGKA